MSYGKAPVCLGSLGDMRLHEVMYYLYLPIKMTKEYYAIQGLVPQPLELPLNCRQLRPMVERSMAYATAMGRDMSEHYVYLSARRGWATPDNPLNRPGWHCDGFGSDDLNFVWWEGAGTRFWIGRTEKYVSINPQDHKRSLEQFESLARLAPEEIQFPSSGNLYVLDRYVIHSTPAIRHPGMRSYVKVSISKEKYNLEDNSHNHFFSYKWDMVKREDVRNDTSKAQQDFST